VLTRVAVLVAATVAPTITAPLGSVTFPVIVARSLWAQSEPRLLRSVKLKTRTIRCLAYAMDFSFPSSMNVRLTGCCLVVSCLVQ